MMKTLSLEELQTLCIKWQEMLGLSHWQIALQISRAEDMPLPDAQGTSSISFNTEQALITLIDPRDYPDTPFEQDMEVSLVHELLHIPVKYFANPEPCTLRHTHLEAFIERTARLLVSLSRKE